MMNDDWYEGVINKLMEEANGLENGSLNELQKFKEIDIIGRLYQEAQKISSSYEKDEFERSQKTGWKQYLHSIDINTLIKVCGFTGATLLVIVAEKKGILVPKQINPIVNKIM